MSNQIKLTKLHTLNEGEMAKMVDAPARCEACKTIYQSPTTGTLLNRCACGGELKTLNKVSQLTGLDCEDLPFKALAECVVKWKREWQSKAVQLERELAEAKRACAEKDVVLNYLLERNAMGYLSFLGFDKIYKNKINHALSNHAGEDYVHKGELELVAELGKVKIEELRSVLRGMLDINRAANNPHVAICSCNDCKTIKYANQIIKRHSL